MVPIIPLVLFCGDLQIMRNSEITYLVLEKGWILFQVEEHKVCTMLIHFASNSFFTTTR